MANCGTNKYNQSEYYDLIQHIFIGDYVEYINERFDPKTANALIRGISEDQSDPSSGLRDLDLINDFLFNFDSEAEPELEMKESSIPDYATMDDQVSLTSYAETAENGGVRTEYNSYVNSFKEQIIERCLLKDGKLIDPSSVSENLFKYRLELLNHILEFIHPGTKVSDFKTDAQFTSFVKTILAQFADRMRNTDRSEWGEYFGSFIKLKHFDHFLTDEASFITIKPDFVKSNTLGKDMYVSTGPFNYKDRFSSFSEEAGAEDYTSSFVKLLLWYFKVDGKPIGLDGFQAVAGKIIEWVEANSEEGNLQAALYSGLDKSLNPGKKDFGVEYLFKEFIDKAPITTNLRKTAEAILQNIFATDSPLENKIKKIFLNQLTTYVRYAYLAYRIKYDPDSEEKGVYAMRFVSDLLQSDLVDKQTYSIQRIIKNRVYTLRHNPNLYEELIKKYDIEIKQNRIVLNANGESQINLYKDSAFSDTKYTLEITAERDANDAIIKYKFGSTGESVSSNAISYDFIKNFIEDVTGLVFPSDAVEIFQTANPGDNMWDSFVRVAAITLTASYKAKTNDDNETINLFPGYSYLYKNEELKLFKYYSDFEPLGRFYNVVYGTELNTVIRNSEGNNLPTHQLRTSVFDVKHYIYNITKRKYTQHSNSKVYDEKEKVWKQVALGKHVFGNNYFVKNPDVIGTIAMRSETKIDETTRNSQQLLPDEVVHEAIEVDFFHNLFGNNAITKTRKKRWERNQSEVSIWLQPIVYSDKRTHFIIEYRIDKVKIGGIGLDSILKTVCSFNPERSEKIKILENEILNVRKDKYETQALNLINRFAKAFPEWSLTRQPGESVLKYFERAKKKLHEFYENNIDVEHLEESKAKLLESLENRFGTNVDIYNESDISVADSGEIFFNPTLDRQLQTYSDLDSTKFKNRIKSQKLAFIRDLIEIGYVLDPSINPNLRTTFSKWKEDNPEWFDEYDDTMYLFKATDKNNQPFFIDWTNIEDVNLSEFEIELNPILEGYFYAENLLSNQFNDLLFGDVNGYNAKHATYKLKDANSLLDDMFYVEDEASRLADMAKRTVLAGASRITFAQGLKYGIDSHALIASIEDLRCPVFNFTGASDNFKAVDGSTLVHSVFARLQNFSLLDKRVGNQRKKTFANGIDPETGTAFELKHAEYTLTNEFRRIGCEHADFSYELLYKQMSSIKSNKFGEIDLSKYYGNTSFKNEENENITLLNHPIYRFNVDTLLWERLIDIKQNGKSVTAYWQAYNEDGTVIYGLDPQPQDFELNTLYDLDQLFGGAYCGVFNKETNQFEFSEINQDLLTIIVCEENLKTDFISLAANHSATKVGVKNLNKGNVAKDNVPLKYWEMSTLSYGIQMNPDHDIEDTHGVREMSQMISALIQGGYLTGEVNEIYKMIGEVALDAVRTTIDAVEKEDQEKIYEIVGQALLKAFDTNQKDVLGLAQSFIAMANHDLETGTFKTRIPFSANTIKGSFQATITSFLNKDAIRRRYAGMGGINTPSFGGIQYFRYKGQKLNWIEFLKATGGKRNADVLLKDLSWNGVQFNNPTIKKISPNKLRLGDTIVYRSDVLGTKVVKLNTPNLLYEYKYYNDKGDLYLWSVKPTDLAGSETTFTDVNGRTYSIYDTDLVRIITESQNYVKAFKTDKDALKIRSQYFYVDVDNNIIKNEDETPKLKLRGVIYYNLIRNAFKDRIISTNDLLDLDIIADLFKQAKWDIQQKLLPQLSAAKNGGTIDIQECMKAPISSIDEWVKDDRKISLSHTDVHTIEAGIGKMSAKKLGLKTGITINDVLTQGSNFFKKNLEKQIWKPTYVDPELYDAVLYNTNGKQTLVVVGNLNDIGDKLNHFQSNDSYKLRGNNYWKDGVDYGNATGIVFRQYIDEDGRSYDVAIVNSWNTFDKLSHSGNYSNAVYNFNESNWKDLVKYRYSFNFDKSGNLIQSIANTQEGRAIIEQTSDGDLYNVIPISNLLRNLNTLEHNRQLKFIERRANDMFDAFKLQLKLIIDRIPSQSMQSFTSADVVMLLDTEENTITFSPFLLWLQGADLDIDKSFTITYEIGEDGRVIVPTKLSRYFSATQCLELPLPNRKKFVYYSSKEYADKVLNKEIEDNGLRITSDDTKFGASYSLVKKVLNSSGVVVFDESVSIPLQNRLQRLIKLHQDSVNLPIQVKTAGYRNKIVHTMHKVLRDPIVQAQLNIPVDVAMAELSNAIPIPKYRAELYRTWDNPIVKFRVQRDNMVGREVIGISAVSLKGFFAETAFGNLVINNITNLVNSYKENPSVDIGNQIIDQLKKICFAYKFKRDENVKSGIATIGNLNFKSLQAAASDLSGIVFNTSLESNRLKLTEDSKSVLSLYNKTDDVGNITLDIKTLVNDLNIYANGTYKKPKDAPLTLSGYTSFATDNAKELKLVKMNATPKFADIHTFLATIGCFPSDVIKFMASDAFKLVTRFSENSIFNSNTAWLNTENAVKFILDEQCLPIIKDYMFESALIDTEIGGFIRSLDDKHIYQIAKTVDLNLDRLKNDTVEHLRVIEDSWGDKIKRKKMISKIYSLLQEEPEYMNNVLLKVIGEKIKNSPYRNAHDNFVDEEMLWDQSFSQDELESMLDDDFDYDQNAFFKDHYNLKKEDWIEIYKYVKNYLIPKNKALTKLKANWDVNNENDPIEQYEKLEKILDAVQEQRMLGTLCGINQGMDTNDFDEYNNVIKIEKYINKKYRKYLLENPNEKLDAFNFIKFLTNPEEQQKQIEQYEKCADTYNILEILIDVPHYNAMSKLIATNRYLIQRSVALTMERELASAIVLADKPVNNEVDKQIGIGYTQSLTAKEWSAIRQYVNDLLILKWFEQQSDLQIGLPADIIYYISGEPKSNRDINGKPIVQSMSLNNLNTLATFKRLMDTWIIPRLKRAFPNNAFLRDLTTGSIHNKTLNRLQVFYGPSFDFSKASKNPALELRYTDISKDFNEIAKAYLPETEGLSSLNVNGSNWRIGDLFFIYNLIVHKDGFGSQSLTRLFEDSNTSGDNFVYNKQFYSYLSKLDSREIDYKELFNAELTPDQNAGSNANDYLMDLRIRLADSPRADYKFRIRSEMEGNDYRVIPLDVDGNNREMENLNRDLDPSDFTLWFPYKLTSTGQSKRVKASIQKALKIEKNTVLEDITFKGVSKSVLGVVIDKLNDILGNRIVFAINNVDLEKMRETKSGPIMFMDDEDFLRTKNANAFIYKGKIYINTDVASIDAPVHEILHIFMAMMKYGKNQALKTKYFDLLDSVVSDPNNRGRYLQLQKDYSGRRDSDIKEELLVEIVANGFASNFEHNYTDFTTKLEGNVTQSDLINFTISAINNLFEANVPENIDGVTLGNTTIRDIISLFSDGFKNVERATISSTIIPTDERVREIKANLFKRGIITFNNECI